MINNCKRRISIRFMMIMTAVILAIMIIPVSAVTVHAESGAEKTISGLGVSSLRNPYTGNGGWCKVYYGNSRSPLRFKVLNTHEIVFGGDTLLIDCDSIISRDYAALWWDYHWSQSQLQGATYFDTKARLTDAEIGAVLNSSKAELAPGDIHPVYDPQGILDYEFEPIKSDKFFLLDAAEAMNVNYGFPPNRNKTDLRKKSGNGNDYWLRSKSGHWSQADSVAYVKGDGGLTKKFAGNYGSSEKPEVEAGISPAMNINLDQILFTSLVSGVVRSPGSEYKLTILDNTPYPQYIGDLGLETKIGQVTRHGNEIRVPFNVSGKRVQNANRMSYLITDKAWNAEGAKIIQYGKLDITSGNVTSTGEGSFELPDTYDRDNPDHHVYVFVEDANELKQTDYASNPVELDVPPANIRVKAEPFDGVYDGEEHGMEVSVEPKYAEIQYGTTEGTYDLETPPKYTDAGEYTVYYKATAEDYDTVEGSVAIKVAPRPVSVRGVDVSDKEYDGTTEAVLDASRAAIDNVVDNEYIDITALGLYRDANAEENKLVTLSYTLSGRDGTNVDNYVLDTKNSQMETSSSITKRTVWVDGITAVDKVDDDYLNVELNFDEVVIHNMIEGDDLGVTAAGNLRPGFETLVEETVFFNHMELTGSDKDNYLLDTENSQDRTTVTIWPNGFVFVNVSEKTHVYDGQPHTIKVTPTDTVEGSDPSKIHIKYKASESGTWQTEPITLTDAGTTTIYYQVVDDNIYDSTINTVEGVSTLKITPKPVKVTAAEGLTKVYDGTAGAPEDFDISGAVIDGKVEGDDVYVESGTVVYEDANAGDDKTVLLSGLTLGGSEEKVNNYTLEPSAQLSGTIEKRPVTVSGIGASDKVYDGKTKAEIQTNNMMVQNVLDGDDVTVKPTGSFEDPNVNINDEGDVIGRTINITYELSGKDIDNYYIDIENSQTTTAATIHKKDLAVGGANIEADYDGTVYGGAEATVDTDVEFEIKYSENEGGEYELTEAPEYKDAGLHLIFFQVTSKNTNYNDAAGVVFIRIHPRALVVTGITAKNKSYDGTAEAKLVTSKMQVKNLVEGDDVTVAASGAFVNTEEGNGKTVKISYELSGQSRGNYYIDENKSQTIAKANIERNVILLAKMTAKGKKGLVISWNKVKRAEGYDIFFTNCTKKTYKKVKTIKGNKKFKWTKKNLKKGKAYKSYVKAFVMKDGKKSYIKKSPVVHAYASGQTKVRTNPKSVTVKKAKISLKAGKTYKIKASVKKLKKSKKLMTKGHAPKLRYVSRDKMIATVSKTGKITAKAKGHCKIYVFAVNGVRKAVTVTVK